MGMNLCCARKWQRGMRVGCGVLHNLREAPRTKHGLAHGEGGGSTASYVASNFVVIQMMISLVQLYKEV